MKLRKIENEQMALEVLSDEKKLNALFRDNEKFIQKIVHNFGVHDGEDFHDMVQVGRIAIWKALKGFKTGRSASFVTYAYSSIHKNVMQFNMKRTKYELPKSSLEEPWMKRSFGNSGTEDQLQEYREDKFAEYSKRITLEDEIIDRVDREEKMKLLSPMDISILELKKQGKSHVEVSKHLDMSVHTFKAYYLGPFAKKMRTAFPEEYEKMAAASGKKR